MTIMELCEMKDQNGKNNPPKSSDDGCTVDDLHKLVVEGFKFGTMFTFDIVDLA